MKLRYKSTGTLTDGNSWNMAATAEVLTGDDTVPISDLDVEINGQWKDMIQAFKDRDIVSDNYNRYFGPPINEECKARGYNP